MIYVNRGCAVEKFNVIATVATILRWHWTAKHIIFFLIYSNCTIFHWIGCRFHIDNIKAASIWTLHEVYLYHIPLWALTCHPTHIQATHTVISISRNLKLIFRCIQHSKYTIFTSVLINLIMQVSNKHSLNDQQHWSNCSVM